MIFTLHPRLDADTVFVTDLEICRVLLMNNSNFPWLILVPMREGITEIFDLSQEDYKQTMAEVRNITQAFQKFTSGEKMNVVTLGNVVSQLHIHIIARFKNDATWPNPVWNNNLPATTYSQKNVEFLIKELHEIC